MRDDQVLVISGSMCKHSVDVTESLASGPHRKARGLRTAVAILRARMMVKGDGWLARLIRAWCW